MTKRIGLFGVLFFISVQALAVECKLEKPIPLSGDLLERGLFLKSVKVDAVPRFTEPGMFDPNTDSLDLDIFNIVWNQNKTNYLGVNLGIQKKLESVGFSQSYSGNFNFQGSISDSNGVKTYHTRSVTRYEEPQHAKNDAIHEAQVSVERNQVTSIALTFPVFKVWKTDGRSEFIAFTGEHQTLCVVDAR